MFAVSLPLLREPSRREKLGVSESDHEQERREQRHREQHRRADPAGVREPESGEAELRRCSDRAIIFGRSALAVQRLDRAKRGTVFRRQRFKSRAEA